MAKDFALPAVEDDLMRQTPPFKRYALTRTGVLKREEGVKRLRLVRMEAIAELDRVAAAPASRSGSRM